MLDHFAAFAAITLYFICAILLVLKLRQHALLSKVSRTWLLLPGFLAIIAHAATLQNSMVSDAGINFGFYSALSLISVITTLFALVASLRHPVEIIAVVFMPLAIPIIVLDLLQTSSHFLPQGDINGLLAHILISLVAYSLLGLAALHAIILSIQNRLLHTHITGGFIRILPPLKTMESLLFELILVGFICLSFSLVSGLIFLENMFAQQMVHKTILSIIAWLVFGILLGGHWLLGWRGRTAIRWTLGGFISLMLAYFGSKFVLEVILV